jgi:hypothetical protein
MPPSGIPSLSYSGPSSSAAAQGGTLGNAVTFSGATSSGISSNGALALGGSLGLIVLAIIGIAIMFRR